MKSYRLIYSERAKKDVKKLDPYTKQMIKSWIEKRLLHSENPRAHGKALTGNHKALTGNHKGEWRYRIGDYRLICAIEDERLVILALALGHRREVY